MYVEYSSNNSGGGWWLTDQNWLDLEKAGWLVKWHWFKNVYEDGREIFEDGLPKLERKPEEGAKFSWDNAKVGDRFLGALANHAYRKGLSLREAAAEWERITGACATDLGCTCCGQPHNFTEYDDNGKYVASGPDIQISTDWA